MDPFHEALFQRFHKPAADAYRGEENPSGEVRFRARQFRCPHCNALAHQEWWDVEPVRCGERDGFPPAPTVMGERIADWSLSHCQGCQQYSLWANKKLVYPSGMSAIPLPADDMPDDVRTDYLEARAVYVHSTRAAGGLLRVALEKLLKHLGETKDDVNVRIGNLVKKGVALGPLQKAMDSVRVLGNQSVHDGSVKLEDEPETVAFLFKMMNFIVAKAITEQKEIDALYGSLPSSKLDGIEKRDGKKKPA